MPKNEILQECALKQLALIETHLHRLLDGVDVTKLPHLDRMKIVIKLIEQEMKLYQTLALFGDEEPASAVGESLQALLRTLPRGVEVP